MPQSATTPPRRRKSCSCSTARSSLGRCDQIAKGLVDSPAGEGLLELYLKLTGRPPTDRERALALEFLGGQNNQPRWAKLTQVLLCSNAFLYRD